MSEYVSNKVVVNAEALQDLHRRYDAAFADLTLQRNACLLICLSDEQYEALDEVRRLLDTIERVWKQDAPEVG